MNVISTTQSLKKSTNKENQGGCCENTANSVSTINRLMTSISNKLGLSKAIYQK